MQTELNQPATEEHLFSDCYVQQQWVEASRGQRFLNFLIDNLLMRYGLNWASGYAIGYMLASFFPEFYLDMVNERSYEFWITVYLVYFLNYIVYYTFCEKVFNGYTLGKIITGTRAVRQDGKELSFKDALLRSLARIVPFEAFSAFGGYPWHDQWTRTMVIKSR